ncbi:hypothetical protein SHEWT2_01302 [Shewanella hafniensis]|nr:hypothetical protein SHEWT2_01302 [Shewanella hafniensis]
MMNSNIPSGWHICTISDVAKVNPSKIIAEPDLVAGFVPMSLAPTDFNGQLQFEEKPWGEIQKSYTNFQNGDVIFAKVTPCFENGKAAIVDDLPNGIGAGSSEFYVLRPEQGAISNRLLFALLKTNTFAQNGAENMTGAVGLRRVPRTFVEGFEFPLPPAAEQKVIADKLDTVLAQVETTKARLERIPEILKSFRQSVLAAAVSGKLTEEWREANACVDDVLNNIQAEKKHWIKNNPMHNEVKRVVKRVKEYSSRPDVTELDLPETWSSSHLEDCVLMIVDCHNKTAPYTEVGNPLIRTSNIRDGKFVWENLKFVSDETYEFWSRRCPPESGDIIFTREAPMGEAAIVPAESKLCLGQRTMLIRPIEKFVSAKFLLMSFMDPNFRKRSEEIAVGTGVKHYRVGDVSNLVLGVPPTNEQLQIVNQVEELFAFADSIEQKATAALARVNNLTQSILAKAFRGELTADWRAANPELISGDNSAAALLDKINAERAALALSKKSRASKKV